MYKPYLYILGLHKMKKTPEEKQNTFQIAGN